MENTDKRSSVRCNEHPDAPHGFLRNASHNAGRYVCECEFWEPPKEKQKPVGYVTGFYGGYCVIQPTDPAVVLPVGTALYRAPTEEHMSDKEKLAQWMIEKGYATGHGDTIEDLLQELEWQIAENSKWVGLTDEESISLLVKANKPKRGQQFTTAPEMAAEFGRLVSELLKERNT